MTVKGLFNPVPTRMTCSSSHLTNSLQKYLHSPEFCQRKPDYSPDVFEKVMRYAAPLGSHIELHASLPRCMGRLKEMISNPQQDEKPVPSGTVIIAEKLQEGCGRFDRDWYAPEGGLWLAIAWADTLLSEFAGLLPLAAGIGSCETVRHFGVNAAVKWVNDVHVQGRKIAGVLCETVTGKHPADRYHLIGIGINCNNILFPQELQGAATSISKELGKEIDLESFTVELLANLAWSFGLVHLAEEKALGWQRDGMQGVFSNPVIAEWKRLSDSVGRQITYGYDVVNKPLYEARVKDIDQSGALIMQLPNGDTVTEASGEIIYQNNQI